MNRFSNDTALFQKIIFPTDPEIDPGVGPSIEEDSDALLLTGDLNITGSLVIDTDLDVTGDIAGNTLETVGNITAGATLTAVDGAFSGDITVDNITATTNVIGSYAEFLGGALFSDNVAVENVDSDAVLQADILNVGQSAFLPQTSISELSVISSANIPSLVSDTAVISDLTSVDIVAETIRLEQNDYGAGGTVSAEGLISSDTKIQSPLFIANVDVDATTSYGFFLNAGKLDEYGVDAHLEAMDVLGWYGFKASLVWNRILTGTIALATQTHEDGKYGTGLALFNTPNDTDEQLYHIRLANEYTYLDQDVIMDETKYQYWGDPDTEGTIRMGLDSGAFVFQQNQSSVWVTLLQIPEST